MHSSLHAFLSCILYCDQARLGCIPLFALSSIASSTAIKQEKDASFSSTFLQLNPQVK